MTQNLLFVLVFVKFPDRQRGDKMGIDRKHLPLRLPASLAQRPSSVWLNIICYMTSWVSS